MNNNLHIRLEQPQDYFTTELLTRESFWNVYRPGCTEHYVLNQYRTNPDFMPELSFVMEADGKIIGHVMYSKAELTTGDGRRIPSWTFGPISIHPDYRRKGYGLKLLSYSIEKAREIGVGFLCMEGNIEFYRHAGFVLASELGICYHSEPKDSEVPYFLAQEIIPGWLADNGITEATYCPPKGYFVADENPDAFEEYDAAFPAKEKLLQTGQLPQFCQSCGMPLGDEVISTNADGSRNFDYCLYCYKDGAFTGDYTMEEMADFCTQFVELYNKETGQQLTKEEYKNVLLGFYPHLKRWRLADSQQPHAAHPQKQRFIEEINALGIPGMTEIDNLFMLQGSFVNQTYNINGNTVKLLDDNASYWCNQIQKDDGRCFGIACDEHAILVSEYGNDGADAEIVVYKRI